jgi:hypothetical protein
MYEEALTEVTDLISTELAGAKIKKNETRCRGMYCSLSGEGADDGGRMTLILLLTRHVVDIAGADDDVDARC